jgi:predicted nucleotidyltransferase component of viral defense system
MDKVYVDTVRLMLGIAPQVFQRPPFAMKGGTALNIFLHDMPRLSVDMGVVFVDHRTSRDAALSTIQDELRSLARRLEPLGYKSSLLNTNDGNEVKIVVSRDNVSVKIEVNYNFRGTLLPVTAMRIAGKAEDLFATEVTVPSLAQEELYGGKIVAALDRQHPRDFFDVREMLLRRHLDQAVLDCFVGYLSGHNHTVHEILFSQDKSMTVLYEQQFQGMTSEPVSLAELEEARHSLRQLLQEGLQDRHKQFLLGLVRLEPDWSLMPFAHLQELPALKWKMQNLATLRRRNPKKFELQSTELAKHFGSQ